MSRADDEETQLRFLRSLAFEIHRKRPAIEAMIDAIEQEGRGGRHRAFREARTKLEEEGFVAALSAAGFIGAEAAQLLDIIVGGGDHRQLANALNRLADFHETIVKEG